mgnify:FL=1
MNCLSVINEQGEEQVMYEPDPALHQDEFHASTTPNVLALGTRGTGKSLQLRMDAILRCLLVPNFQALIVRRTMPELRKSHLVYIEYEMKLLGGIFLRTVSTAKFPNGSSIVFAHCETEADILNFLSSQYGFIGFDELSTFTLNQFLQISAACRAPTDAPYQAVVRAGSNPLGVGAEWMKTWFVTKTVRLEDFPDYNPDDYQMIFSKLEDNKHLDHERYANRLKNLPDHVRRAWLLGEFVMEGAYFADFRRVNDAGEPWHVIPTIPVLKDRTTNQALPIFNYTWLSVYRAIDWGYFPDPAVCLWIAVLPNKQAIVFKERTWKKTLAADVAAQIKRESEGLHIIETFCDPTMMIKTGAVYSIGELFENTGVPLTAAKNDRRDFGYAVHNYLNTIIDGTPQLQIVKPMGIYGCPELIRTFPQLQMDPHDPTKIANGEDHWVVALAYFCMGQAQPSRDPVIPVIPYWMQPKKRSRLYA